jgi:hypothetical protein
MTTPADFMAAAPAPLNGSSPWAARYAAELRRVVTEHAARAPRQLQVHLGPSELGHVCDRQVVGKMAGLPVTNHVSDPWPSIVGTAVHAWMAEAFTGDNARRGVRWVPEQRVTPHPDHPGTADLYDGLEQALVDHKVLGPTSMAKVRSPEGPARHYLVQLLLYGRGYRLLGLPVRRVVLAAWPRTGSSLDGLYVWEREHSPADDALLEQVFTQTAARAAAAVAVHDGRLDISQIPNTPDADACFFCPLYRPQASRDDLYGCPGTVHTPLSTVQR